MPGRRALSVSLVVVAALAIAAVAFVAFRDEQAPVRGDLIAYSCREPGNPWYAVCVIGVDGTGPRRLVERLPTTDPAWSPDGRRIAVTRNEEVGEFTKFTADDVFVMDADGSGSHQVTAEKDGQAAGQPAWSPDGREIAFVLGRAQASETLGRFGELFVMRPDGSDPHRVTDGLTANPAWSPDGREIAFTRGSELNLPTGSMDIHVVVATGGEPRALTDTASFFETTPAWSPDGKRIAYARSNDRTLFDGRMELWIMNRDGSRKTLILRHPYFARSPYSLAWSPDGRTIAFETSPAIGCTAISLVEVGTGAVRPLTTCSRPVESTLAPAWQPAVHLP